MDGPSGTPFATASDTYSGVSTKLTDLSQKLAGLPVEGGGATIATLVTNVERRAQWAQEMAQDATDVSDVCSDQADADIEFSSAVSAADVDSARAKVLEAQRGLADGSVTAEEMQAAVDTYNEANTARNEARRVHEEATTGTDIPDTTFPSSSADVPVTNSSDSSEMSGEAPSASASSGGSGSDMPSSSSGSSGPSDSASSEAGDTELSSDTAAPSSGSPMLAQTPMAQQPAAASGAPQQPQMAPMQPQTPTGAVPSAAAKDRLDTAALARDRAGSRSAFGTPRLDTSIGTQTSGASGDTDRGSSNSGTTTRADTSGSSKTALSGSTAAAPGTAGQQGQGMMRGGGMMGGMGGGMMGGQGGNGSAKERPQILTTDPDLLGTEDESNSVASGILGRDTAIDPNRDR